MKPVFKKKEIIIKAPSKGINLGGDKKELVAEVLYVGEEQIYYKAGDKVLYIHTPSYNDKTIKYFGEEILRFDNEAYVLCQLIEE